MRPMKNIILNPYRLGMAQMTCNCVAEGRKRTGVTRIGVGGGGIFPAILGQRLNNGVDDLHP